MNGENLCPLLCPHRSIGPSVPSPSSFVVRFVCPESVDLAGVAEGGFAPEQEKEEEEKKEGRAGEWMRLRPRRSLPVFRVPSQFATHRERFLAMAPSTAAATSKEVWYEEGRAAIHFP